MTNITIKQFINILWKHFFDNEPLRESDLFHYAHTRGWIEDQDERFCDNILNRQTAARILHQFMKIELRIPDLANITPANVLADLYTCHTCVNHIAQIYLREIISAQTIERDGKIFQIFNQLEEISREEISSAIEKIKP